MKTVKFLFVLLFILSTPLQLFGRVTESAENLLHVIHRVNRHWQENNSPQVRSFGTMLPITRAIWRFMN